MVEWYIGHVLAREESLCRGLTQGRNRECGAFDELTEVQCGQTSGCKAEAGARNEAGKGSRGTSQRTMCIFLKAVGRH